jgi:hypothetical protein
MSRNLEQRSSHQKNTKLTAGQLSKLRHVTLCKTTSNCPLLRYLALFVFHKVINVLPDLEILILFHPLQVCPPQSPSVLNSSSPSTICLLSWSSSEQMYSKNVPHSHCIKQECEIKSKINGGQNGC